jgi:amino acid transporter
MSDPDSARDNITFSKVLARREVIALSFGAMIGWSWVLLTGTWVERAGVGGAVLAFAIGGIAVIFISLTYAELASAMPKAGGEHIYTHRAFGRTASFVCTWALIMAYVAVPVFESVALPTALEYIFPELRAGLLWEVAGSPVYASLVAVGVIGALVMSAVNFVGIRFAAVVQSIITLVFFLIGIVFMTGTTANGASENMGPLFTAGVGGAMGVLIMVPALLVGFDVIPQSAEEIDVPPEQIGKLLIVSVVLAVIWYILITTAVAFALDAEGRANASIATADAMAAIFNSTLAGKIMIIGGIGGLLTSWNAFIVGGSRVIYALAKSGMLPPVFARLHPKYKTPYVGILMIAFLSCIAPFFGRTILVWIIDAGSFAIVIAYGMVAAAFIKLRLSEPDMPRPFKVRYGMPVGILAVLMSFGLFLIYLPGSPSALIWPYEWAMVLGWGALGALLYFMAK